MNFRIAILLILVAVSSCKREKINFIDNLHGGKIIICGHGGAGFQSYVNPYPTNSFASIQRALEGLNADGVEIDVQMTKDLELYLYHDEELDLSTDCSGCIPGRLASEINNCRFNKNMSVNVFQDIKLIRLETILARYSGMASPKYFYFDMRLRNVCDPSQAPDKDSLANRVVEMISKYSGHKYMPVISGDTIFLNKVKKLDPNISLILENPNASESIAMSVLHGYQGIISSNENITREQAKEAHLNNLEVIIFNVKRRNATIDAVNKSPDVIQTDNIQLLQEILREHR
jgi:glycerophosphoryl diester phosphodiesterase